MQPSTTEHASAPLRVQRSLRYQVASLAVWGIAVQLGPPLSDWLYASMGRAQQMSLEALGVDAWAPVAPPLGAALLASTAWAAGVGAVVAAGLVLLMVEAAKATGRTGADRLLLALYAPWPFRVLVQWGLVRGVCGTLAAMTDVLLLALPAAVIVAFGQLAAQGALAAVGLVVGFSTPPLPMERYAALGGEAALAHVARDVLLGVVATALWLRGRRGFGGILWATWREHLLPLYTDEKRRDLARHVRDPRGNAQR